MIKGQGTKVACNADAGLRSAFHLILVGVAPRNTDTHVSINPTLQPLPGTKKLALRLHRILGLALPADCRGLTRSVLGAAFLFGDSDCRCFSLPQTFSKTPQDTVCRKL